MYKAVVRKPVSPSEWEWFGVAGHFICGRWCRFHLCTKVGKYLVSTVGEFVPLSAAQNERAEAEWLKKNWPGEDVGYDRKYETMVFIAGPRCVSSTCGCGLPEISGSEKDMLGYSTSREATKGHLSLCHKWAKR